MAIYEGFELTHTAKYHCLNVAITITVVLYFQVRLISFLAEKAAKKLEEHRLIQSQELDSIA
jgi:hypothetical protein